MSTIEPRPFSAATNKFAYAQAFSRATLSRHDDVTERRGRLRSLLHRTPRARRTSAV